MTEVSSRADVIDAVWSAAGDGRWHSLRSLVEHMQFEAGEVIDALDFLVRYGFARSSCSKEYRFKVIRSGPSPIEAARILRSVELLANRRFSHDP